MKNKQHQNEQKMSLYNTLLVSAALAAGVKLLLGVHFGFWALFAGIFVVWAGLLGGHSHVLAETSVIKPSKPSPKKNTAILVIHGIGQQKPLSTLGSFAKLLSGPGGIQAKSAVEHHLALRKEGGDSWQESFVRIPKDKGGSVDLYEYYWAPHMEGLSNFSSILKWMSRTAWRAVLGKHAQNDGKSAGGRIWHRSGLASKYLMIIFLSAAVWALRTVTLKRFRNIGWSAAFAWLIYLAASQPYVQSLLIRLVGMALDLLGISIPLPQAPMDAAPQWGMLIGTALGAGVFAFLNYFYIDFLGDVVVYTSAEADPRYYRARKAILEGAEDAVVRLLKDKKYQRVIVAGHSLGSVVGYDVLARLNLGSTSRAGTPSPSELKKLTGFATFGSPLDKIHYNFLSPVFKGESIRTQITWDRYSYRKVEPGVELKPKLARKFKGKLPRKRADLPWLNVDAWGDPVGADLDFYTQVDNFTLTKKTFPGYSHVQYWNDKEFAAMLREYFRL